MPPITGSSFYDILIVTLTLIELFKKITIPYLYENEEGGNKVGRSHKPDLVEVMCFYVQLHLNLLAYFGLPRSMPIDPVLK